MFLIASGAGADAIIGKEVGSIFKECEWMNCFKPYIQKVPSNADKA